mgnify:CR=1 FL=1
MLLLADSGSTKTEWRLFNADGVIQSITSKGLNPLFFTEESFLGELKNSIQEKWIEEVTKLWFYGAGCGTTNVKLQTSEWLARVFKKAAIEVDSDLLGAARASCGSEQGIVAILGTGSNSALYDGAKLVEHIKPLGYILGDEGSGTALGKSLLKKLLREEFSPQLSKLLYTELGLSYEEVIQQVYRSEFPNRFIASCTRLLHAHMDDGEIQRLINNELDNFVFLLSKYSKSNELTLNFVGSIAYYFESNLKEVVSKRGLTLGNIVKNPADQLVSFHKKNL